ncbi:NAD-dependent epimerase, partial [Actinomadura adrarensis]
GAAGLPAPALAEMPEDELDRLGREEPIMAEIQEMSYLDRMPHVLDYSDTEREFGLKPTPLDEVLEEILRERV